MPLYHYQDPETGVEVELIRPVEDRNKPIVLTRTSTAPDRLLVVGAQLTKEQAFDQNILKGYYKREEREGSRFRSGYTKKQLAKVYAEARAL